MLVVVVDASVLVSGMLTNGPPARLLDLAQAGAFEPCISEIILPETRRPSLKPKVLRACGDTEPTVDVFLDMLLSRARQVVSPPAIPPTCRDPDDDHVLAAALAASLLRLPPMPTLSSPATATCWTSAASAASKSSPRERSWNACKGKPPMVDCRSDQA